MGVSCLRCLRKLRDKIETADLGKYMTFQSTREMALHYTLEHHFHLTQSRKDLLET